MKISKETKAPPHSYLKKALQLAKEYFTQSDDRYIAWLLAIGAVLSVFVFVALVTLFSSWTVGFWAALTASNFPLFISSMQTFTLIVSGLVGINALKNYFAESLSIRWRNWLTEKLINQYVSAAKVNYLDLTRHADQLDNPGQRIQSDVQTFVSQTLSLSLDFLSSVVTQFSFIGILWVVGGALSFVVLGASITIPGYLVWSALLFSTVASVITQYIGLSLVGLSKQQENLEANFRKAMDLLSNEAEAIAQEKGDGYYRQSLTNKLKEISQNSFKIMSVNINLSIFKGFYQQLGFVFPYIVAAPLYFMGQTALGQLMQIGFSFSQIQNSLDWFVNSYEALAAYKASLDRIIELENAFGGNKLNSTEKAITIQEIETNDLVVSNLQIAYPTSTDFMMRKLNVTFKHGESTLIKGQSGLGKSTLFKVIAGTWKYGKGGVTVSDSSKMCFLPQRPSLPPNDTLKAVLAYPDSVETYTKEQYIAVLAEIGNMDKFINELETKADWSKRLSPGQQQRLAFARALLKKPDWLFLDEATASLDAEGEEHVYNLVKTKLKNTTFISIAHRSTVGKFHERIINFIPNEDRVIQIREEKDCETHLDASNDDNSILSQSAF